MFIWDEQNTIKYILAAIRIKIIQTFERTHFLKQIKMFIEYYIDYFVFTFNIKLTT